MSIRLMVAAFRARVGHPGKKLVLLKLADFSNDEGICWPSRRRLAKDTELSDSSVKRYLAALEKEGWIKAQRRVQDGVNLPTFFILQGLLPLAEGVGSGRPHPVHTEPGVGSGRPHPVHTEPGVGSGRPQGWGHTDPLTYQIEPVIEPQQRTHARAREEAPARRGGGVAAASSSNPSTPTTLGGGRGQQGKARRRRPSGIITWNASDIYEAERIEQQNDASDIKQAVESLEKQCLDPVPGRVSQELEKLAKAREAARRQEEIMTKASQPCFDPAAKAKGDAILSKIRARRQERVCHEASL